MARLLIVDDDKQICRSLLRVFSDMGHQVETAHTLDHGLETASRKNFEVIFLDVRLPDGSGLDSLEQFQGTPGNPEVIVMTGYADSEGAQAAMVSDAWDYIQKPASTTALSQALDNALEYHSQKSLADPLKDFDADGLVGQSPALKSCLALAAQCAKNDANVLITGQSGTGKELFARIIHQNSRRAKKNFVVVDCGGLPKTLAEGILFGHSKGAYTGAHKDETGLVEHAHGGTLFLDEVAELPLSVQKAFLRFLEERRFRPLGSVDEVHSDFRLLSATNKDLAQMAGNKGFREDLLYRLRAVSIHLPALHERGEDVVLLARNYVDRLCERANMTPKRFSPNFVKTLETYPWPGNIRELFHTLDSVFAAAFAEPAFFSRHLPGAIRAKAARALYSQVRETEEESASLGLDTNTPWKDFKKALNDAGEKKYLTDLLKRAGKDVKKASVLSGLSSPRIYELLRKHQIHTR